jgi:hypothetical protein
MFAVQVTGTAAELQLIAVQTGTSVEVRIELATIGGSIAGAATARVAKLKAANRAADFLNRCALAGG